MRALIKMVMMIIIPSLTFAEKALIANCEEGAGCTFTISDASTEDVGIVLNDVDIYENTKSGDVIVFGKKKNGEELVYKESGKTRSQIDRAWGGDGYTMIYAFPPGSQPLDGQWQASYGNVTGSSCYVDVVSIFKKSLKGIAGAGNINFKKPFTPAQLFPSAAMKWKQVGFSKYVGMLDFGGGATSFMKMQYSINVASEKKIETVYDVTITIPVKGVCKSRIPVMFSLLKAAKPKRVFDKGLAVKEDDLLEIKANPKKDELLPINPKSKKDELLPIEPGKKPKPKVERIEADVKRLED